MTLESKANVDKSIGDHTSTTSVKKSKHKVTKKRTVVHTYGLPSQFCAAYRYTLKLYQPDVTTDQINNSIHDVARDLQKWIMSAYPNEN